MHAKSTKQLGHPYLSVVQDDMVGSDGVPSKPPVSPGPPDKDDDHPSTFTPVMASGDRVCLK